MWALLISLCNLWILSSESSQSRKNATWSILQRRILIIMIQIPGMVSISSSSQLRSIFHPRLKYYLLVRWAYCPSYYTCWIVPHTACGTHIHIQDKRRLCSNRQARKIIGISDKREKVKLPDLSNTEWKYAFIQSTSRIRTLPEGSLFMYCKSIITYNIIILS